MTPIPYGSLKSHQLPGSVLIPREALAACSTMKGELLAGLRAAWGACSVAPALCTRQVF
jgi:hypothetical protein